MLARRAVRITLNNLLKNVGIWLVIGLVVLIVVKQFDARQTTRDAVSYTDFMDQAKSGKVESATIEGRTIRWVGTDKKTNVTYSPGDIWMVGDLVKDGVKVQAKPEEEQSFLAQVFISWFPMLLLIGVWIFFMRQMQGGGRGGAFSFGKSKARMLDESNNTVTFADVAGCDEAKEEVAELVEFLRDPSKFQKLGGRIPRGVLMVGNPGTGKTLLAKAIAGEAKVPFFSISGSDFVEMFVGVGAARVRDMFEQAKKNAPCIVFIDEIDAVGRQRGAGLGGGNDEREQTLNQLLVEMDGFEGNAGVIVIAATNRPDVLDPALMRPGRFDRQVVVPLPDIRGREQILLVHMRKVPVAGDVKAEVIARGTPGFSGADLANLVNEAALFAARKSKRLVDMDDFEMAKDKIMMGAERKSMVMSDEEKKNTAYHESGHTVVAKLLPKSDPVHKVTIIPRGRALGVTMQLPEQDRYSYDRDYLLQRIAVLFGGRIAEEIFMHQMTTGAEQRLRARDADGARHGHALRHVRHAGPDGLRRERGRGVPRPLDRDAEERVRGDDAEGRSRDPAHHRRAVRAGAQADRGQPRQGRGDGQGAARSRDARQRPGRGHHAGPPAASAEAGGSAARARPSVRIPVPTPRLRPILPRRRQVFDQRQARSAVEPALGPSMLADLPGTLICGRHRVALDRPRVMGVLNVTPDSFFDGGRYADRDRALDHARQMLDDGADIIDIGGESTRPGAAPTSEQQELDRVLPLFEALRAECDARGVPLSVDTRKPAVMRAAIAAGASMVNDINALRADGALDAVAGERRRGLPDAHAGRAADDAATRRVRGRCRRDRDRLSRRARAACEGAGIARERIASIRALVSARRSNIISSCCGGLREIVALGYPVARRPVAQIDDRHADRARRRGARRRQPRGGARGGRPRRVVVRVHDVRETVDALKVWQAVQADRCAAQAEAREFIMAVLSDWRMSIRP